MVGLPDSSTVEVEFISGTWIDVTTYVSADDTVTIRAGRTTEFDDVGPASCTLVFRNDDGRFTPDSSGSPYYPYVTEGRRLRVTVTQSAVAYHLFTGTILSWEPSFGDRLTSSMVTVTANDPLAQLALHTFDSRHVEATRALARTATTWVDIYPLAGDATTRAWNNIGFVTSGSLGTATLIPATTGAGEVSYAAPDSLVIESGVEFKPVTGAGMVADIVPGAATPKAVSFWLRVTSGTLPASNRYAFLLRGSSADLGSLRLLNSAGSCNLIVSNAAGSTLTTLVTGVADDKWRLVSLTSSGTSTVCAVTTASGTITYTAAFNITTAVAFYLGGESAAGSAVDCADGITVAGLSVAGDASVVPAVTDALAAQTHSHTALFTTLQSFVPEVTSWTATGVNLTTLGEPTWAGSNALAVLQILARSITGVAYADGSGTVTLAANDIVRPTSPAATLDIEQDLDSESAQPTLRRAADSRPTRVTVDYAGGATTLIDTTAETNGRPRREQTLTTCCVNATDATNAGQYLLTVVNGLRITQVAVDLTTSVQDLWAAFLTLFPTQTFVLSGFDAALIGATSLTVYAQGWQVAISHDALTYTLDCSPGGEYVAAIWDAGNEYGRWSADSTMTITSGTAIGTTANGTLIITTTASSPALSTTAGDYPCYLDWNGEKVQITAAPGGSSSPQTVTTTARGVVPSAARSNHIAGETVDIWHAAIFGS